jgi:hypothetical protein
MVWYGIVYCLAWYVRYGMHGITRYSKELCDMAWYYLYDSVCTVYTVLCIMYILWYDRMWYGIV